jgi:hypothetical protein
MLDSINIKKQHSTQEDLQALIERSGANQRIENRLAIEQSAILMEDGFNVRVSQFRRKDNRNPRPPSYNSFINVPSIAQFLGHPDNLSTCSPETFREFSEKLTNKVQRIFPDFRFEESEITRLDLSMTLALGQPWLNYSRLLRNLPLELPLSIEHTEQSLVFKNNWNHRITVYDKLSQLGYGQQELSQLTQSLGKPVRSLIRFEERYQKAIVVQHQLGINNGADLLKYVHLISSHFRFKIRTAMEKLNVPPMGANLPERITKTLLESAPWSSQVRGLLICKLFGEIDSFFPGLLDARARLLNGLERINGRRFLNSVRREAQSQPVFLSETDQILKDELVAALTEPLLC